MVVRRQASCSVSCKELSIKVSSGKVRPVVRYPLMAPRPQVGLRTVKLWFLHDSETPPFDTLSNASGNSSKLYPRQASIPLLLTADELNSFNTCAL